MIVNRRGQAALEFLMTYGWAILVVLIAIGALAYFGVLNPSKFLPASCVLMPGISCNDFKINTTTISLVIRNGIGDTLTPFSINISSTAVLCANNGAIASSGLTDGESETLNIACATGAVGARFKTDMTINYNTSAGVTHSRTGSLVGQIE